MLGSDSAVAMRTEAEELIFRCDPPSRLWLDCLLSSQNFDSTAQARAPLATNIRVTIPDDSQAVYGILPDSGTEACAHELLDASVC